MKRWLTRIAVPALALALAAPAAAQERRPLRVDDIFALKNVRDPRISPEGEWVAYTVAWMDEKDDRWRTDIYMAPLAGGEPVRLTSSDEAERQPRWSPDGRYLAFLSGRDGKKTQVWLLDRRGGEAVRLTDYRADVSDLAWSPDGTRLALVVKDVDPDEAELQDENDKENGKRPKPIVIRRLQFKRDGVGYLDDRRDHLHVFDVNAKTSVQVTLGPYDHRSPVWSSDGEWLAFVSNRTPEPDSNFNTDIFIVRATGGEARNVTDSPEAESSPAFSPDGTQIAYLRGGEPSDMWYATNNIAVRPVQGGAERILTAGLDRNVSDPRWSPDGRSVLFLLEDGGSTHLARVSAAGGRIDRVVAGERDIDSFDVGREGELAVLESQPHYPPEISSVDASGTLSRVTRTNDGFLSGIALGPVERFTAKAPGGPVIDAFLTRPPGAPAGRRLPTLLRIHGGPVSQFSNRFNLEWQLFAAHGYAVVGPNPRGSSGHGRDFSYAIWADWGNRDYDDVVAAVDEAIAKGVSDPDRLGVGGWSYGGILTNYVITKTGRFKAAVSGSSEVNYLANYGHDHYQREWEMELGLPWQHADRWVSLSPFFQVEQITTPTLVMCGQEDWNVPLINSEQLYQALRRLGRDTELVVYPGENHGIRRPSFVKDRYERYLAWYDRYLQPAAPATAER